MQANPSSPDSELFTAIQHQWQQTIEERDAVLRDLKRVKKKLRDTRVQRTMWIGALLFTMASAVIERLVS